MNDYPIIKKITFNRYKFPLENMRSHILSSCYEPGSTTVRQVVSIKIDTERENEPLYLHSKLIFTFLV